jgi:hypothetical protein
MHKKPLEELLKELEQEMLRLGYLGGQESLDSKKALEKRIFLSKTC